MPTGRLPIFLLMLTAACGAGAASPAPTTAPSPIATAAPGAPPPARFEVDVTRGVAVAGPITADLYRPAGDGPWPLVVLVPGGAWSSADRSSTAPLARDLAARGAVVLNTSYRLGYPESFADVACAVSVATAGAAGWDADPGRLVLAGHSAGAHVAAVVALGSPERAGDCSAPGGDATPRAFVGIAGPYDVETFAPVPELRLFFGGAPAAAPEAWSAGNPYTYVAGNPDVAVDLVHGRTDLAVLPVFSLEFARALREAGRAVDVYLIPGANHRDVLEPGENAGETSAVILAAAG